MAFLPNIQGIRVTGSLTGITSITVTGNTNLASVTANTLNVTGVTRLDGVTADTLTVTGNTRLAGLTATTISAGTYSNLPNTLYTGNGTLSSNRVVDISDKNLFFSSATNADAFIINTFGVGIKRQATSVYGFEVNSRSAFFESFVQGDVSTNTTGFLSFVHGSNNIGMANYSHVEGSYNTSKQPAAALRPGDISNGVIIITGGDYTGDFTTEYIMLDDRGDDNIIGLNIFKIKSLFFDGFDTYITLYDLSVNTGNRFSIGLVGQSGSISLFAGGIVGDYSHAEGTGNFSVGNWSHVEGSGSTSFGLYSHAEGYQTVSVGTYSHSEGNNTKSFGVNSHAEGVSTYALTNGSHAEGLSAFTGQYGYISDSGYNISSGSIFLNDTYGDISSLFVSGEYIIYDDRDFDNTYGLTAFRISSSGWDGTNTNIALVTNVNGTQAYISLPYVSTPIYAEKIIGSGFSHSEGVSTISLGYGSHAQGFNSTSLGQYSFVSGVGLIGINNNSTVVGQYNDVESSDVDDLFVIGNGTSNTSRSNVSAFRSNEIIFNQPLNIIPNNGLRLTSLTNNDTNPYLLSTDGSGTVQFSNISIFLLLASGGTVSGATTFISGLAANTLTVTGNTRLASVTANTLTVTGVTRLASTTANTLNVTGNTTLANTTANTLTVTGNTVLASTTANTLTVTGNTRLASVTANTLTVTGLTQTSGITSTGGITFPQKTVTSTYTATTSDYMIDVTGGTFNIYLPTAVGVQGKLYAIKNNGGGAVTIYPFGSEKLDDKSFLILSETNSVQLVSNGSQFVILGQDRSTVNNSTGVFVFTGLSKVSSTQFSVAPVKGWIVDTSNPLSPQILYVGFTGGTYTDNFVTTANETYVYLTSGATIEQQTSALTEQQRRQNIFLGKLGHPDRTSINLVFSQPDSVLSPLSQLRDVFIPINLINGGVYPSPNGSNLSFNTSAGFIYGLGINFSNDILSPNAVTVSGTSPCTFQYRTSTGGSITDVTVIDPTKYDVGGVVTNISGVKATNQRIFLLQNGTFRVQYGQTTYNQLSDAIASLQTETFTIFPNFVNNAILIGVLSVISNATNLSDTSKAQFLLVSKFGETVGAAGGLSTTTLQQAYNNSTNPEIVINSTLDGLSIQNGTGNPDNVTNLLEGRSSGSGTTSYIRADGGIYGNSLSAVTVSATTYLNYPDTFVTGFTLNNNNILTISQNRSDLYSALTVSLSAVTGTSYTISGLTANTIFTDYVDFNTNISVSSQVGRLRYDNGEGGLVQTLKGGNVDLQIGQQNVVYCFNEDTVTLNKGTVVYISGGQGNRPAVKRAIASAETLSSTALGVVSETIASGAEGFITTFGNVKNFLLTGITPGSYVYLSPTVLGDFTGTQPQAPNHIVAIGYVVRTGNTQGEIFVNINNGWELNELHNVKIENPQQNDILQYSAGTFPVWYNTSSPTLNGLSVTGNTSLSSLTATTISATTYQNVNAVTGGTYNNITGTITLSGTGNVNGNTITGFSTGSGGLTWQFATSPITASTNSGYITTGTTSIALPTVASLGSTIEVVAASDNLFTITQNANQFIRFGIVTTTTGVGGTLVSQNNGDAIKLVCTSANTVFTVVSAVGTLTLN